MTRVIVGCCGWNYGDSFAEGGWVGSFYPDTKTKRLSYYSQFFSAAEFDAIFYEKFYSKMGHGTFEGMIKATPPAFEFSVVAVENQVCMLGEIVLVVDGIAITIHKVAFPFVLVLE